MTVTVRFVGSGDAFGSGGRFQTCMVVDGPGIRFAMDFGTTSLVALLFVLFAPRKCFTISRPLGGEIAIRNANAFAGLGQDHCRRRQHIIGTNTFRLVLSAAHTLWFTAQVDRGPVVPLCRDRPWYRQTVAPSQLDVVWACRETLYAAGLFPIPRCTPELAEHDEEPEHALPLAA